MDILSVVTLIFRKEFDTVEFFIQVLAWAWLAKPKAIVVIPKFKPCQIVHEKTRVNVQSTANIYAKERPVKINIYSG